MGGTELHGANYTPDFKLSHGNEDIFLDFQ